MVKTPTQGFVPGALHSYASIKSKRILCAVVMPSTTVQTKSERSERAG
jgi:hypothetical protein